jgi:hypothetical protein
MGNIEKAFSGPCQSYPEVIVFEATSIFPDRKLSPHKNAGVNDGIPREH